MIPITISGRKYKIKSIPELTTAEFIDLSTIENLDFVKYIAWQTGASLDSVFFAVVSKSVEKAIGTVPDITKMPRPKLPYISYKKTIQTVGQRHQIEASNLEGYKLIVFILAVSQACSPNIDEVNRLYDRYMKLPFIEILPSGFFFLQTSESGSNFGQSFLTKLTRLIKTLNSRRRQASRT